MWCANMRKNRSSERLVATEQQRNASWSSGPHGGSGGTRPVATEQQRNASWSGRFRWRARNAVRGVATEQQRNASWSGRSSLGTACAHGRDRAAKECKLERQILARYSVRSRSRQSSKGMQVGAGQQRKHRPVQQLSRQSSKGMQVGAVPPPGPPWSLKSSKGMQVGASSSRITAASNRGRDRAAKECKLERTADLKRNASRSVRPVPRLSSGRRQVKEGMQVWSVVAKSVCNKGMQVGARLRSPDNGAPIRSLKSSKGMQAGALRRNASWSGMPQAANDPEPQGRDRAAKECKLERGSGHGRLCSQACRDRAAKTGMQSWSENRQRTREECKLERVLIVRSE
jgi:hypothetical protein